MIKTGPSRFILINAGRYGYGEIVVNRPVQLVGANNVGKTTLINAFQFLLIDDEKQMRFPKGLKETKAFYFQDTYSYILLEVITPTGFRVLGAHGLGPVKNHTMERFAFEGEFRKEIFIGQDSRVREFDAIKADLAAYNFTMLEPRHLKAALTGIGESKGVSLGLVPLRDHNHYSSFQAVFKNLLHLNNLRQDELKEVLLQVYKNAFALDHIDLTGAYGDRFQKVLKQREDIRLLSSVRPLVADAVGMMDRMAELQGLLPSLYAFIEKKLLADGEVHRERMERLDRELADLEENQRAAHKSSEALQASINEVDVKMGIIAREISDVRSLQEKFTSFSPDIEAVNLRRMEEEAEDLGGRLRGASRDDPGRLKEQIGKVRNAIRQDRQLLEKSRDLLVTRLKEMFPDHQLESLFSLLNPAMLSLVQGDGGFTVTDETLLEQRLNALLAFMDSHGRHYRDGSVEILLDALERPDITDFTDPASVTERLGENEIILTDLEQRLEAAENAAGLKALKQRLDDETQVLRRKLFEYEDFKTKEQGLPEKTAMEKKLAKERELLGRELKDNNGLLGELGAQRMSIVQEKQERERLRTRQIDDVRSLTPPSLDWEAKDLPDPGADRIEELTPLYRDYSREEEVLSGKIDSLILTIESRTSSSYSRGSDRETVRCLCEEIDGLDEREKANTHDWYDLVAGLGNAFKELNTSYETFKSKMTALNRQLAKVSISNLSRLQLEVADEHKWVRKLKQIAINQESPLFADMDAQDDIYKEFSEILRNMPYLHLRDLFTLHFVVETPDGNVTTYPNFDSIESNGTTITIKILVNLILLKSLFGKTMFRIPYYLDEAPNLSSKNLLAILRVSEQLGFTPILAGTIAVDAADVLYFMSQSRGKIWMKPHFRMDIQRSHAVDEV